MTGVTAVDADVEAKRVVVTSEESGATAEAMLAALMKWCVGLRVGCGSMESDWGSYVLTIDLSLCIYAGARPAGRAWSCSPPKF